MSDDNNLKWKLLQAKVFEQRICRAFELFRGNGIEPVLIKGWAAGLNYPNPCERVYTDIDLAVGAEHYRRAVELADEHNLYVDIHRELRHLDKTDWGDLFENSELIFIGQTPVRVLRPEDHLRVLCVHWLNDGGAYKERLRDIYYAVDNRRAGFDWARCLDTISETRRHWILCVIALTEKYLNLDIRETPIVELKRDIPKWVLETIEREWNSDVKLKPLSASLATKKDLFEQIKLRLPPNAIQSTIEMEGDFDEKTRLPYQIGSILLRAKISARRILKTAVKKGFDS